MTRKTAKIMTANDKTNEIRLDQQADRSHKHRLDRCITNRYSIIFVTKWIFVTSKKYHVLFVRIQFSMILFFTNLPRHILLQLTNDSDIQRKN